MKIFIFGVTGLLGNNLFKDLSHYPDLEVRGIVRTKNDFELFEQIDKNRLIFFEDLFSMNHIENFFFQEKPDMVINCIGLLKNTTYEFRDYMLINSIFPVRLSVICKMFDIRLIHFSTDCVFDGAVGNYLETDLYSANDIYGISKYCAERNIINAFIFRTSIIGYEIKNFTGLLSWFLKQKNYCYGYRNVYFNGLTTSYISEVIYKYILPRPSMLGIYNIGSETISKYDLLKKFNFILKRHVNILQDSTIKINRSLNTSKFKNECGYCVPSWDFLLDHMLAHKP